MSLAVGEAPGQTTLAIDGKVAVVRELGGVADITVTGIAGQPAVLLIDISAGPTVVYGHSAPIGFSPLLITLPLGKLPAGGSLTVPLPLNRSPRAHGATYYLWAVTGDPAAAFGLAFANGATVSLVARPQLAGNSLKMFPFFEAVAAINRGSSVECSIDSRYEFIAGKIADVYVVASRTKTQWRSNTALVDARGTPQRMVFPALPIGATSMPRVTFQLDAGTLPGPDEKASSGDIRIGVGYDVVIDFGRDGRFDEASDLIDGFDDREAGFYIVRDTVRGGLKTATGRGPYPVSEVLYTFGSFLGQDTYYPTNIAKLGKLPLVVVSHGNGHDFQWYDHIGYHLASFGFVVMSHQNNTRPGSHTAAWSTVQNTNRFLGKLSTIAGGKLVGHIDSNRITWIGHSRGGDGVVRAYDQLFRKVVAPSNYKISDIKLVSSIAPVDFGGWSGQSPVLGGAGNGSHPHDANFHLWVAQADSDVHGCASFAAVQWYRIHDRATNKRQSISLYGVGHGDYHDGGGSSWASGPDLIGRWRTHQIMRGYLLPLVKYHIEGDVPSRDFLWRQYEGFRPVGAPTQRVVSANLMFQDEKASGKYIIDDFQDQAASSITVATCGATVSTTTAFFREGRLADNNTSFTFGGDPYNGFLFDSVSPTDPWRANSYGCVFSSLGTTSVHLTFDLSTARNRPDFWDYRYLSFRAAQGTRHPLTVAARGDVTFDVTLEDEAGNRSTINIGAYGGGVEEPYQRTGCGFGAGWTSEFETVRIRLRDFLNGNSGVNLAKVKRLIFDFGPKHGSTVARIGLDEIELTRR